MAEQPVANAATILVVDDEPSVCEFLKNTLRSETRRLLIASSGQEALTRASRQQIDVVLLDLKMPGVGGIETLRRLLEIDAGLAVIVLTGYGSIDTAREAMRLGAYDYLTKPVDAALLEEVIADSLHLKQKIRVHTKQ